MRAPRKWGRDRKRALRREMLKPRKRKPARKAGFFVLADRDLVLAERVLVLGDRVRP